jgi:hypothetical protein
LDANAVGDVCVDTTDMSIPEVVQKVRERTSSWPALPGSSLQSIPVEHAAQIQMPTGGQVLWLCGATGVGKSTVGFTIYQRTLHAGMAAAFIDLDQIGFCGVAPSNHGLRARILAATWQNYFAAGARRLIMVGPVGDENSAATYAEALPVATIMLHRLHASKRELTKRILLRQQGGSWSQPGDRLKGKSFSTLRRIADRAVADAKVLDHVNVGARLDTGGLTVEEAADAIVARTDWLAGTA